MASPEEILTLVTAGDKDQNHCFISCLVAKAVALSTSMEKVNADQGERESLMEPKSGHAFLGMLFSWSKYQ